MLVRHTLLYMPAQLLGPLFQFIAAVVWTHFLPANDYGVLTYVLASHELIAIGCLAWWSQYSLRFAGAYKDADGRRRFQAAENAVILCGLPAQAVLVVMLLSAQHVPLSVAMIVLASICCISRSVTAHLCERARGAGRVFIYTVAQSVGPVAGFAIALALVRYCDATPAMALAGYAVAQSAIIPWIWRQMDLPWTIARPDASIIRGALAFGVPMIIAGGVMWFSANGIRIVVAHVRGADAVGLLSVGWGLGQRLSSVVAMLVTAAAFPLAVKHLVDGSREGAIRQLAMGGAILYAVVAPSAVGIILVAEPLVDLMIAERFREMTLVVLPLAALTGAVRNLRIHFCDQIFILFEHTHITIIINIVEAAATLGLCYVGALWAGPAGAVAGCLAGATLGALFGFAYGVLHFGLVIPWDHVARITAATAVMASVLMTPAMRALTLPPLELLIVDIVIAGATYGAALMALYPLAMAQVCQRARVFRLALR